MGGDMSMTSVIPPPRTYPETHTSTLGCCAVKELCNVSDSDHPLLEIGRHLHSEPPAFVVFTQTAPGRYGAALARELRKAGLGQVVKSRPRRNPNTGNRVTVYLWEVNRKAWKRWYAKRAGEIADLFY